MVRRIGLLLLVAMFFASCTQNTNAPDAEKSSAEAAVSSGVDISKTNSSKEDSNTDAVESQIPATTETTEATEQHEEEDHSEHDSSYKGLMILPSYEIENTKLQHDAFLPQNSYYKRIYNESDDVLYEYFRLLNANWYEVENPDSSLEDMILNAYVKIYEPHAYDINVAANDTISEMTTYPSYNVSFFKGDEEYKYISEAIVVLTDEWLFCFNVDLPVDVYDNHKYDIEQWFRSIAFAEDSDVEKLGSLSPTLLFGDIKEGFDAEAGIDMDLAMIRIMREFYLEEYYQEKDRPKTAYRYEGFGDLNNEAVMMFSFGDSIDGDYEDNEHLAINSRGKLYILMEYNGEYSSQD